jgi:hypothetical protein
VRHTLGLDVASDFEAAPVYGLGFDDGGANVDVVVAVEVEVVVSSHCCSTVGSYSFFCSLVAVGATTRNMEKIPIIKMWEIDYILTV